MSYTVLSDEDRTKMLGVLGLSSSDDLFREIPVSLQTGILNDLPAALSEQEIFNYMKNAAGMNRNFLSFTGAGLYPHYIPAAIDHLVSRSEFFTSYTPYQAEVSQGTLTAIFEFQTYISRLAGLDIANASLYDGATALAESVLMSARITRRRQVVVSHWLHPHYRDVLITYCRAAGIEIDMLPGRDGQTMPGDISAIIRKDTAAVVIQSPSCVGTIEDIRSIADCAHNAGALCITVVTEALSLAFLKAPGETGADIVCGEAQSLGIPLSFGGPLLGFLAARREFLRQMPGRLAGKTTDRDGNDVFCLTLQTREQHVRRERATSNICTNQGLCMLRSVIYLSLMGPKLMDLAVHNHGRAGKFRMMMQERGFILRYTAPYFNEMIFSIGDAIRIHDAMRQKGIDPGFPAAGWFPDLDDCLIVAVTEAHGDEHLEKFFRVFDEITGIS